MRFNIRQINFHFLSFFLGLAVGTTATFFTDRLISVNFYNTAGVHLPEPVKVADFPESDFTYRFHTDGILEEAPSPEQSASPYFWLNSGAHLIIEDDLGKTVNNELDKFSKWRQIYAKSNPLDTDEGFHPQNIFRLVTRHVWESAKYEVSFKVLKINKSESPNRNASNGFFIMNRYQDSDTLYYIGLRVDGAAVIKKKINGEYHTLAYEPYILGEYNETTNPNLIPLDTWIHLRSEVRNIDNKVLINLYIKKDDEMWGKAAEVIDDGRKFGGDAIVKKGFSGIRTDFMDVEFDNFRIGKL
jgi:hypothetical protein